MKVFYIPQSDNTGRLISFHNSDQPVPDNAYGPDVFNFVVPDDYQLIRIGPPPTTNIDTRLIEIPVQSLETIKSNAIAEVMTAITAASDTILNSFPQCETLSWGLKLEAATAYLNKADLTDAQKQILDAETTISGETTEELAQTIVKNGIYFAKIAGSFSGLRKSAMSRISAETDSSQIPAIVSDLKAKIQQNLTTTN